MLHQATLGGLLDGSWWGPVAGKTCGDQKLELLSCSHSLKKGRAKSGVNGPLCQRGEASIKIPVEAGV